MLLENDSNELYEMKSKVVQNRQIDMWTIAAFYVNDFTENRMSLNERRKNKGDRKRRKTKKSE